MSKRKRSEKDEDLGEEEEEIILSSPVFPDISPIEKRRRVRTKYPELPSKFHEKLEILFKKAFPGAEDFTMAEVKMTFPEIKKWRLYGYRVEAKSTQVCELIILTNEMNMWVERVKNIRIPDTFWRKSQKYGVKEEHYYLFQRVFQHMLRSKLINDKTAHSPSADCVTKSYAEWFPLLRRNHVEGKGYSWSSNELTLVCSVCGKKIAMSMRKPLKTGSGNSQSAAIVLE